MSWGNHFSLSSLCSVLASISGQCIQHLAGCPCCRGFICKWMGKIRWYFRAYMLDIAKTVVKNHQIWSLLSGSLQSRWKLVVNSWQARIPNYVRLLFCFCFLRTLSEWVEPRTLGDSVPHWPRKGSAGVSTAGGKDRVLLGPAYFFPLSQFPGRGLADSLFLRGSA